MKGWNGERGHEFGGRLTLFTRPPSVRNCIGKNAEFMQPKREQVELCI